MQKRLGGTSPQPGGGNLPPIYPAGNLVRRFGLVGRTVEHRQTKARPELEGIGTATPAEIEIRQRYRIVTAANPEPNDVDVDADPVEAHEIDERDRERAIGPQAQPVEGHRIEFGKRSLANVGSGHQPWRYS